MKVKHDLMFCFRKKRTHMNLRKEKGGREPFVLRKKTKWESKK